MKILKFCINVIGFFLALAALYVFWIYVGQDYFAQNNDNTSVTYIDEQTGAIHTQEKTVRRCINLPVIGNCPE